MFLKKRYVKNYRLNWLIFIARLKQWYYQRKSFLTLEDQQFKIKQNKTKKKFCHWWNYPIKYF